MSTGVAVFVVALLLGMVAALPVSAQESKPENVELVTVVGCLRQDSGELPWLIERAGMGVAATRAYTSREELEAAAAQELGMEEYCLVGVDDFGVEPHVGHKVQAKGLRFKIEGEWRLNLTSFQHVAPSCEG